jgi:hypothetical protein
MGITETDLAYAAGIIDGEGSIVAHVAEGPYGHQTMAHVSVPNTNLELVEWFRATFGGKVRPLKNRNKRCKTIYQWMISSKDEIKEFLILVQPYLKVKYEHAKFMLILVENIGYRGIREEDRMKVVKKMILVEKLHELNKRGVDVEEEKKEEKEGA